VKITNKRLIANVIGCEGLPRCLICAIESGARFCQSGVECRPGICSCLGEFVELFLNGGCIGLHPRDGRIDFASPLDREFFSGSIEFIRC
jgi:hypothetical protein